RTRLTNKMKNTDNYINEIINEFNADCFQFNNTDCKLNNSRIHNIDIRDLNPFTIFFRLIDNPRPLSIEEFYRIVHNHTYIPAIIKDAQSYHGFFTAKGLVDQKIIKQIQNIPSEFSDIREML